MPGQERLMMSESLYYSRYKISYNKTLANFGESTHLLSKKATVINAPMRYLKRRDCKDKRGNHLAPQTNLCPDRHVTLLATSLS